MNKLKFKAFNEPQEPGLYAFQQNASLVPEFAQIIIKDEFLWVITTKDSCPLASFGLKFWTDKIVCSTLV